MYHPNESTEIDQELAALLSYEIQQLREKLDGQLLVAGDAGYECARQAGELLFENSPGFVVRAQSLDDVFVAYAFAARYELPVVLRRAGWVISQAHCTDGVLIDQAE